MSEKLNMRQRKFAEYYVQTGNAAESAKRAGYSESYATHRTDEMLRNVEISAYIKELNDKNKDERILTAKDRQVILSDIANDDMNVPSDRIKAIDTLNKMTGEYLNKVELSGSLTAETSKLDELVKQMRDTS